MKILYIKRVAKNSRRWFFDNSIFKQGDGQMVLVFMGTFGIEYFYAKCDIKKDSLWFYVDVPSVASFFAKKVLQIYTIDGVNFEQKVFRSDKFEDLI